MTGTGSSTDVNTSRASAPPTRWTGWIVFASFMMLLNGSISVIQGLAALFNSGYYQVDKGAIAITVSYSVWGWVHLLLGLAVFAAGLGVWSGNLAARSVGVVLAGINALVSLVFIEAAPAWCVIMITVDVFVIYALTVHGREMADPRR